MAGRKHENGKQVVSIFAPHQESNAVRGKERRFDPE